MELDYRSHEDKETYEKEVDQLITISVFTVFRSRLNEKFLAFDWESGVIFKITIVIFD